ncbi:hypothetical protein GCM10022220_34210 [Actinocatenispora rupis]|uniref:PH domain-containing protein n=1 Tax=Actinocatenispora rupis TaxID=519421 RepID=A0A8J3J7A1_9ACTN|nr:hypothetical protein Aru02nite_38200 [Actinocatenispora rupis]
MRGGSGAGRPVASLMRVYQRVVPVAVRRLIGFDSKGIVSLGLWVTGRRHGVPRGAVALTYSKTQTALLATFLALSVAELVAVELLLRALGVAVAVRTPLLILDAYGVLIGVTVIAGCVTRPHVVTTDEIRIRYGVFFDLRVPRTRIASVRRVREYGERGAVRVADGVAVVAVAGQTSILLELDGPVGVVRPFGRPAEVTRVRFHADDPDTAIAVLRGEVAAVR